MASSWETSAPSSARSSYLTHNASDKRSRSLYISGKVCSRAKNLFLNALGIGVEVRNGESTEPVRFWTSSILRGEMRKAFATGVFGGAVGLIVGAVIGILSGGIGVPVGCVVGVVVGATIGATLSLAVGIVRRHLELVGTPRNRLRTLSIAYGSGKDGVVKGHTTHGQSVLHIPQYHTDTYPSQEEEEEELRESRSTEGFPSSPRPLGSPPE
ncbi:MAG: hypothetical protein OXF02_06200 [Simkaniaceae bacterium]|nr:hypothetical protein [Simkaniaceae bacterium]